MRRAKPNRTRRQVERDPHEGVYATFQNNARLCEFDASSNRGEGDAGHLRQCRSASRRRDMDDERRRPTPVGGGLRGGCLTESSLELAADTLDQHWPIGVPEAAATKTYRQHQ